MTIVGAVPRLESAAIESVPPLTTVLPVKVLESSRTSVPPLRSKPPDPEIATALKFVPCVSVPLLLKASVPLSMIVLAVLIVASAPLPPLPSCKMPPEMVVLPL